MKAEWSGKRLSNLNQNKQDEWQGGAESSVHGLQWHIRDSSRFLTKSQQRGTFKKFQYRDLFIAEHASTLPTRSFLISHHLNTVWMYYLDKQVRTIRAGTLISHTRQKFIKNRDIQVIADITICKIKFIIQSFKRNCNQLKETPLTPTRRWNTWERIKMNLHKEHRRISLKASQRCKLIERKWKVLLEPFLIE